jgi:O-antigen/teichoic acid export membrane protein
MSVQQGMLSGAKWALVAKWYNRLIGICSTLILLRLLDVSDFGVVALATFFVSLFAALSQAGAVRYILVKDNLTPDQISSVWSLNIAIRALFTAILIVSAPLLAAYTNAPEMRLVLTVISFNLLISSFRNVGLDLQEKTFNFRQLTLTLIVSKTVSVIVSISLALVWQNYWALIVGTVVLQSVEVIAGYWLCAYRPYWCSKHWKEQWSFSKWTVATSIFGYLRSRIDILLLGNLVSTKSVGLYSTAQEFSWLPMTEITFPLQRGLLAGYSSVKSSIAKMRDIACNQLALNFALLVPSAFGTFAVAELFVKVVLGPNWLEAIPVVKHVTWLMMSAMLYLPLMPSLIAREKFKLVLVLDSVIIALVCAGFYLFRDQGIEGLSYIRAIVALIFSVFLLFVYKYTLGVGLRFFSKLSFVVLTPTLLMYWVVSLCTQLPYSDGITLAICVGTGVSVYVPSLLLLSFLYRHQLPQVWKLCIGIVHVVNNQIAKLDWRPQ